MKIAGCYEKGYKQQNETLANRLIDILTRLNSGEKTTIKMLAEIHIVHSKTIRRDLVRLESCNYQFITRDDIFI